MPTNRAAKAVAKRAANTAARDGEGRPGTESANLYNLNRAFRVVLGFIDHIECLPELERLVPDKPKHSAHPRAVTVRALIAAMIALPLAREMNHESHIAPLLCPLDADGNPNLAPDIRDALRLPAAKTVTRRMVRHTNELLKEALKIEITIGDPDNGTEHTATLANILGVDIPQAILATSGNVALYKTASGSLDTTAMESHSRFATSYDDDGNIKKQGSDPDARYIHKTANRDKREIVPGYKLEAIVAVPDIPNNRIRRPDNAPFIPGLPLALRFHNGNHSGIELVDTLRILQAREHHLTSIVGDLGFTGYAPENWATPCHQLGIDLVHDLTEHNREPSKHGNPTYISPQRETRTIHTIYDRDGEPVNDLIVIDGTVFERHLLGHLERQGLVDIPKPEWPNVNTAADPNRVERNAERRQAFDIRAAIAWREHDTRTPGTYRLQGPGRGKGRTIWCINHKPTWAGKGKVPQSPCKKGDNCHCNTTITLNEDVNARLRQRHHFGTTKWAERYGARNQVETLFSLPKGGYGEYATPNAIRYRGLQKRATATLGVCAAMALKLLAKDRNERGEPPHPAARPPGPTPGTSPPATQPAAA